MKQIAQMFLGGESPTLRRIYIYYYKDKNAKTLTSEDLTISKDESEDESRTES